MFRIVSNNYSYRWILVAFKLAYKKYFTLTASLILFAVVSALSMQIPYLGYILSAVLIPILIFGQIYMTKDIIETSTTSFKRNFVFFQDKELRTRTWHILILCLIIGIFRLVCAQIYELFPGETPLPTYVFFLVFAEIGLLLFVQSIVIFCANVVIFKKINLWKAIVVSFQMFLKNWKVFTLNGILFFIAILLLSVLISVLIEFVGSEATLAYAYFVGLVTIGPVFITLPYLIYATIFESKDI